jgi:hypothetical protein
MKTIKFQVPDDLWARFYRAFPGVGERSSLMRKCLRHILMLKGEHKPFEELVAESVVETLEPSEYEDCGPELGGDL